MTRSALKIPSAVRLTAVERREQLVNTAVELFSRRGFNGTTTKEIAVAAGVTEAIIFRHFNTKEQLYSAIIDQRLRSPEIAAWISDFQSAMDRNDDEGVVRRLIEAIITTHKVDPKFERLMLYAALEGNKFGLLYMQQMTLSVVEVFRKYFLRRQRKGRVRIIIPDVALAAIVGMAQHHALYKYIYGFEDACQSDEETLKSFTQIAMHGLCLPEQERTAHKTRKR